MDMPRYEMKCHLKEMFNFLTEEDLDNLVKTGDDINVCITRVLDNNYKPMVVDIKDIASISYKPTKYKKDLNYPEVFYNYLYSYDGKTANEYRELARVKHEEAHKMIETGTSSRIFAVEYLTEADKIKEVAQEYDRQAAIKIMRESIENKSLNAEWQDKKSKAPLIDLHRLYIKEAVAFVNDLYQMWDFREINFVTGSKSKNKTLRPIIEKWFEDNSFVTYDLGAIIKGKKR